MMFDNSKLKNLSFILIAIILMTLNFSNNLFHSASDDFFQNHQKDSEALVLGRLIETEKNGYFSNGSFLGLFSPPKGAKQKVIPYNYELFSDGINPNTGLVSYKQSAGFQGVFYSIFNKILILTGVDSGKTRLVSLKAITSLFLSISLVFFLCTIRREFGFFTTLICSSLLLFSQWLTVFGDNLYWMFFLITSPFTVIFFLLSHSEAKAGLPKKTLYLVCLIGYFLILLKSLAGYEYLSTILISATVPFLFWGIRKQWTIKSLFIQGVLFSFSLLLGFISALIIHILQLRSFLGDYSKAFQHIWSIIARRTHGDINSVEERYRTSLESDISEVLLKYWNGYAFNLKALLGINVNITFGHLIMLLLAISLFSITLKRKGDFKRKNYALLSAVWLSILAPLSWYVIAKGHSYIHTHMNHVLWYIPFLLLGFTYVGFILSSLLRSDIVDKKRAIYLALVALFAITMKNTREKSELMDKSQFISQLTPDIEMRQSGNTLLYIAKKCKKENLSVKFFFASVSGGY